MKIFTLILYHYLFNAWSFEMTNIQNKELLEDTYSKLYSFLIMSLLFNAIS